MYGVDSALEIFRSSLILLISCTGDNHLIKSAKLPLPIILISATFVLCDLIHQINFDKLVFKYCMHWSSKLQIKHSH